MAMGDGIWWALRSRLPWGGRGGEPQVSPCCPPPLPEGGQLGVPGRRI